MSTKTKIDEPSPVSLETLIADRLEHDILNSISEALKALGDEDENDVTWVGFDVRGHAEDIAARIAEFAPDRDCDASKQLPR